MIGSQKYDLFQTIEAQSIDFLQCPKNGAEEYSLIGSSKCKLSIKSEFLEEGQREAIRREHQLAVEKKSQRTIKTLGESDNDGNSGTPGAVLSKTFINSSVTKLGKRSIDQAKGRSLGEAGELPKEKNSPTVNRKATGEAVPPAKGTVKSRLQRVITKIRK
jgi:hypothetical protein